MFGMRLLLTLLGGLAVAICCLALLVLSASAETRTPPEVTQHALDERQNCLVRQGAGYPAGYCPTDTPTAVPSSTSTALPAATATPQPTDAPEPTQTPLPILPVGADPLYGYTRPLRDAWIEVALAQGRWAVLQADDCANRVDGWQPVRLDVLDDGEVDLTSSVASCGVVTAQWIAGAPCAQDEQGLCQLLLDASYWDWLGQQPTAVPTGTPAPRPISAPTQTTRAAPPAPPAAAPQIQVRSAIQTVVVEVTPTLPPRPPTPTPRPSPTTTSAPTSTAPVTPSPTATATSLAIGPLAASTEPAPTRSGVDAVTHWDWGGFLLGLLVVTLGVAGIVWLLTHRRVAVWRTR
jgi:hypothetical protein